MHFLLYLFLLSLYHLVTLTRPLQILGTCHLTTTLAAAVADADAAGNHGVVAAVTVWGPFAYIYA